MRGGSAFPGTYLPAFPFRLQPFKSAASFLLTLSERYIFLFWVKYPYKHVVSNPYILLTRCIFYKSFFLKANVSLPQLLVRLNAFKEGFIS